MIYFILIILKKKISLALLWTPERESGERQSFWGVVTNNGFLGFYLFGLFCGLKSSNYGIFRKE